jgi:hypothetical protein
VEVGHKVFVFFSFFSLVVWMWLKLDMLFFNINIYFKKFYIFLLLFNYIVIDHAFVCKWFCKWHKFMIFDVIDIFKQLICHHPLGWAFSKACPYFMFLHPKPKWQQFHDILLTTTWMGWNQLCLIVDKLTMTFHDLKTKFYLTRLRKVLE